MNKALIIAINYVGTDAELRGCASDGERFYAYLKRCCPNCDIRVLCDDRRIKAPIFAAPSYNEILRQIDWLVEGANSQSKLWISYSGHGGSQKVRSRAFEEIKNRVEPLELLSAAKVAEALYNRQVAVPLQDLVGQQRGSKAQVLDARPRKLMHVAHSKKPGSTTGGTIFSTKPITSTPTPAPEPAEVDGCDETILPMDFRRSGEIIDDVLRKRLIDPLPEGARLTAFFDSCHSGTVLDLRYNWQDQDPRSVFPNINKQEFKGLAESRAQVLLLSGCRDSQTSADAFIEGHYCGATTQAFLTTLAKLEQETNAARTRAFGEKKTDDQNLDTLDEFLHAMNSWMSANTYTQRPLISLGRNENVKEAVETFFPILRQ